MKFSENSQQRRYYASITLLILVYYVESTDFDCNYLNFVAKFKRDNFDISQQYWKQRQATFQTNCQEIKKISEQNGQYDVALNNFTDWTSQQMEKFLSFNIDTEIPALRSEKVSSPLKSTNLPKSLNYEKKGKVTPAKDQGLCGSCWAFVATGLFQSMFLIHEDKSLDLSEQYLLECSGAGGCNGGYVMRALNFARKTGFPKDSELPFFNGVQRISLDQCRSVPKINFQRYPRTKKSYTLTDQQLKTLLVKNGPISVAMYAPSSLMFYSRGVYNGCPSSSSSIDKINHGVLVVGYDEDGNWIVKNSWSSDWGNNGFGTISKSKNCGITYYAEYIELTDGTQELTVVLLDIMGNGWNGASIGIRQNNATIHELGADFLDGREKVFRNLTVKMNQTFQIYVISQGSQDRFISMKVYIGLAPLFQYYPSSIDEVEFKVGNILYTGCIDCQFSGYQQGIKASTINLVVTLICLVIICAILVIVIIKLACMACSNKKKIKHLLGKLSKYTGYEKETGMTSTQKLDNSSNSGQSLKKEKELEVNSSRSVNVSVSNANSNRSRMSTEVILNHKNFVKSRFSQNTNEKIIDGIIENEQ